MAQSRSRRWLWPVASCNAASPGPVIAFGYRNDADLGTDAKGIHWGLAKGDGPNIAWFRDPAGNILSVVQDR